MNQEKKIVLCDADDVIENFLDCWITALNKKYNTAVSPSEVTEWDVSLFFPTLTKDEVFAPMQEKGFWNNLERIPGCFEILKEINDKHILRIVTATHYSTCSVKIKRILELYPFLRWNQFIITSHKQLVHGDYLIDDGVHNIVGGDYQGILFSRPHNQLFDATAAGVIRVSEWEEIRSIILEEGGMCYE